MQAKSDAGQTWLIVYAVFLCAAVAMAETTDDSPNVLFIVSDDLNNHLGCYGHSNVHSPNVDRLAKLGMQFEHAYCQVPLCNPSRVSFLSGLRPNRTGVYMLKTPTRAHLGEDAVMLPQYFRAQGYFTAQIGKVFHTGEGHEDPVSWDVEQREFGKRPPVSEIIRSGEPPGPIKHTIDWAVLKTADEETPDGIVARNAAQVMQQAVREDKPFFLGVGFRRPHAPYAAPRKYFDLYPLESISLSPEPPSGHFSNLLPAMHNHAPSPAPMTESQQRELIAAYYACNSFVDAQVGHLLDTLARLDLWERTIVVFFGDHGYHLGDHGGLWHKNSLFEESARVPLIVYVPGMKSAGKPCKRLVELIDLYPTLTQLCDLPPPDGLDGKDFGPLLDDPSIPWKTAAYSSIARNQDRTQHVTAVEFLGRSVRTERWRYTEWDNGRQGTELYDHQNDPQEWVNLADRGAYAETVAECRRLLRQPQASAVPANGSR